MNRRDGLESELAYWREWLTAEHFAAERAERLAGLQRAFPEGFARAVRANGSLRVLDVGSGPITTLPLNSEVPTEVVCVDPLADVYNELLDGWDVPQIEAVKAEELSQHFAAEFHYVYCANALDHCEDPEEGFAEMLAVCRPGGIVSIVSVENEGERQNYEGLHQWNLHVEDEELWLGDKKLSEVNWRWVAAQPRTFQADVRKPKLLP